MTDHKFTDDEVIHHLDCYENLGYRWCGYAIALINRQKADIERLKALVVNSSDNVDKAMVIIERQEAEIKRLTTLAELGAMRANDYRAMRDKAKTARAEAIKEFAWRLKNRLTPYPETPFCEMVGSLDIDALVQEMTEKEV